MSRTVSNVDRPVRSWSEVPLFDHVATVLTCATCGREMTALRASSFCSEFCEQVAP